MKEKWAKWTEEDRPLKKRLLYAVLAGFAISFTFLIFGVLDLYLGNIGMYPFHFVDLLGSSLLIGLVATILVTLVIVVCKGKVFDLVLSLALGFILAGYLQGNFLNLNLGTITGDEIRWEHYTKHSLFNIACWLVILALPFAIRLFKKKMWNYLILLIPIVLIGMQLAGLTVSLLSTDLNQTTVQSDHSSGPKFLSDEGIYEVSADKNVLVFVVDRMDGKYVDEVEEKDPDFFDKLDGFTYYSNNTSIYCRTYPSVAYMLTGELGYFDKPAKQYFSEAYEKGTFIPTLQKNNFTTKLYIHSYYAYTDISQIDSLADNVYRGKTDVVVNKSSMMKRMIRFSAYRYAPHVLKRYFWFHPDAFENTYRVESYGVSEFNKRNIQFAKQLRKNGVTATEGKNNFMYLHLEGCHAPYTLNERGEEVEKSSRAAQTQGVFSLIYEYIDELKRLGVYEDATIIIMGDHGKSEDRQSPETYKTTGMFVKPSGSAGAPLARSHKPVSQENFQATILQAAGIDSTGYGKSIWDVKDDEDVVRKFLYKVNGNKTTGQKARLEEYEIRGDAEKFENWKWVRDIEIQHDH